jgi:hypothetical protein
MSVGLEKTQPHNCQKWWCSWGPSNFAIIVRNSVFWPCTETFHVCHGSKALKHVTLPSPYRQSWEHSALPSPHGQPWNLLHSQSYYLCSCLYLGSKKCSLPPTPVRSCTLIPGDCQKPFYLANKVWFNSVGSVLLSSLFLTIITTVCCPLQIQESILLKLNQKNISHPQSEEPEEPDMGVSNDFLL